MARSTKLQVLQPYQGSADLARVVEAANCDWCRWQGGYRRHLCLHPTQRYQAQEEISLGQCSDWNRNADCVNYQPTLFTRLLQMLFIRRRVWRIEKDEG